jgi:hypothetical protein
MRLSPYGQVQGFYPFGQTGSQAVQDKTEEEIFAEEMQKLQATNESVELGKTDDLNVSQQNMPIRQEERRDDPYPLAAEGDEKEKEVSDPALSMVYRQNARLLQLRLGKFIAHQSATESVGIGKWVA